jgi:hypothetical protein
LEVEGVAKGRREAVPHTPARACDRGWTYARIDAPALNSTGTRTRARHGCFLRTYSARIYFIVSNSSLACLHKPHPSTPFDDTRVRPSHREHPGFAAGSRTFGAAVLCVLVRVARARCQRVERLSDGAPLPFPSLPLFVCAPLWSSFGGCMGNSNSWLPILLLIPMHPCYHSHLPLQLSCTPRPLGSIGCSRESGLRAVQLG